MIDNYLVGMSVLRYFNVRNNSCVDGNFYGGDYMIYHNELDCKVTVSYKYLNEIDFFISSYLKYMNNSDEKLDTDTFLTEIVGEFIDSIDELKIKRDEFTSKLFLLELQK